MSETLLKPQKRILADATMTSGNALPNNASKKRKLDADETPVHLNVPPRSSGLKGFGSSQLQQKSQFEEDLEKLTQDINGLKERNSEKDQQWDRPPLEAFDSAKDNLCFQQIDAEEGTYLSTPTVKLFGVTEVRLHGRLSALENVSDILSRKGTRSFFMSRISSITCTLPPPLASLGRTARATKFSWKTSSLSTDPSSPQCKSQ
jgi:hypothetical protein